MYSFHLILYILGIKSIKDTQCGVKLFTRDSAKLIFSSMHLKGWIFDIEILLKAINLNIPIIEVKVNWHEVNGTKLNLIKDSLKMLKDLLLLRSLYFLGIWEYHDYNSNN